MPNYGPATRITFYLIKPITIQSGAAVNVSTLTPLSGWLNLLDFVSVLFAVQNLDGTNNINLIVETSEDGVHADVTQFLASAPAGEQASYEVGPKFVRTYFRLSAVTDSPFPTVQVNWQIRGLPRA